MDRSLRDHATEHNRHRGSLYDFDRQGSGTLLPAMQAVEPVVPPYFKSWACVAPVAAQGAKPWRAQFSHAEAIACVETVRNTSRCSSFAQSCLFLRLRGTAPDITGKSGNGERVSGVKKGPAGRGQK